MSQGQKQGGGGLVVLLLAAALFVPPANNLRFHVQRFFGLYVTPTRTIIESEIDRAADAWKVSRSVLRALVQVESSYRPDALSPVGARGVAQIMPFNAKRCGLSHDQKLWDAVHNVRCGAQILAEELDQHGDLKKALTVYNCGRVKCREGERYASKVIALSRVM
jgi:soluble lytic murein transglycosylase-like protein